jgi:hypothetical protein
LLLAFSANWAIIIEPLGDYMKFSKTFIKRFESKFIKTNTCWDWIGAKSKRQRGSFRINGKPTLSHRVSYIIYKGKIPKGLSVCHTCDRPICVNPDHLWLGTHAENMHDMSLKGRATSRRGKDNNKTILTEQQVLEIRSKYKPPSAKGKRDGYSSWKLAKEYGVKQPAIHNILQKKSWKWLK